MIRELRIAVPRRDRFPFAAPTADTKPIRMETVAVLLENPEPIVEYLQALRQQCDIENIHVTGVVFGSRPYLSLREHARERCTREFWHWVKVHTNAKGSRKNRRHAGMISFYEAAGRKP